jgi:cation diffusion facilitator CzcD-associated flavoprotein CzcO
MNHDISSVGQLRVLVIGAGMAGVLMAIRLKAAGVRDFKVLEKGPAIGGTWRENRYPGLHCDFPSHVYRYSFHANPEWTYRFAPGPEIRDYFDNAARTFGVFDHIRFNSTVTEARWEGACWKIQVADGSTFTADAVIAATGFLHVPHIPALAGLESFAGPCFHTARWDDSAPLDGRRVGLVGTGSTATQLVCALADWLRKLSIFQRTAQWVARIDNSAISEEERASLRSDPARMDALFEAHYKEMVGLADGAIQARDPTLRQWLEANVQDNLATVRDAELRRKLTPDYKVGCKRLVMSPAFYEAVQKPACELVTEGIERVVPEGVLTRDGRLHELDVLILATGFDPQAYFLPMSVIGEGGKSIREVWKDGPVAYRSMTVPHMPNFFIIEGPFSPVGNVSAVLIAEWQSTYIAGCLNAIAEGKLALVPDPRRTLDMMQRYREATRETIWFTGGCQSWYLDRDGFPILYPFTAQQFEQEMKAAPDLSEYQVRELAIAAGI